MARLTASRSEDEHERGAQLRAPRQPALDRRRAHRADHLPLLRDRLARALEGGLRRDRGAVVGGLHPRLDPAAAGRAAALALGLRAHRASAGPTRTRSGSRRRIQLGISVAFVVDRDRAARADRGRPARRQRDPLLDRRRARSPPTAPATSPAASSPAATGSPLYALLIISRVGLADRLPARGRRSGSPAGQDAVALGIVAAPTLSLIVVPFAFLRRGARRREAEPASRRPERRPAGRSRVHPRPRRRASPRPSS